MTKIQRQLTSVYSQATPNERHVGLLWYAGASDIARTLAAKFSTTKSTVAGILAALSPGREWGKNAEDTETLLIALQRGLRGLDLPLVGTYGRRNINKAERIYCGQHPGAILYSARYFKTQSFYLNIMDPSNSNYVTIDRHAYCAAHNIQQDTDQVVNTANLRGPHYLKLANEYHQAAKRHSLLPCEFQATVWVTWKRLKESFVPF